MVKLMKENKPLVIYFMIVAFTALALGLSNDILSNYFKEAYNISTAQRGMIEFPRETPGVILIIIVSLLSSMNDIKMAMVSQALSIIGIVTLGFMTPSLSVMLIFIFINSMGMHLFFPLQDSIGISLIKDRDQVGKRMGQFKGVSTAFMVIGYGAVFLGFRSGVFSFKSDIKLVFVISGLLLSVVFCLLFYLHRMLDVSKTDQEEFSLDSMGTVFKKNFIIRKEYKFYYALVVLYGVQKQMMIVFGPWVLIELLGVKTENFGLLYIAGAVVGVFFIPMVGRWLDHFGVKKLLYADAVSFIIVYILYGIMSGGLYSGRFATTGWPLIALYALFIIDRMSTQLGLVRSVYLRKIILNDEELRPVLSLGISMDHVMSILSAIVCGVIWENFGPQYIFYIAAFLSLGNLYIATKVESVNSFGARI